MGGGIGRRRPVRASLSEKYETHEQRLTLPLPAERGDGVGVLLGEANSPVKSSSTPSLEESSESMDGEGLPLCLRLFCVAGICKVQ
mmetsp:Transcript_47945/g.89737  ORF Transcript_47945/g.89737 Transcript_47945/m.89737 type:complete len:86 (+) Transcript_47945:145-402(+)